MCHNNTCQLESTLEKKRSTLLKNKNKEKNDKLPNWTDS